MTTLLQLRPLRTDVRHQMLQLLRDRILPLAQNLSDQFSSPAALQALDQRLAQALEEEVDELIREAEVETNVRRKGGPLKSRFARHLCRYLDQ